MTLKVIWALFCQQMDIQPKTWGEVFEVYEIGIIQPNAYHEQGSFRRVRVTAAQIDAFVVHLVEKAHATTLPDAPRNAGSWCMYCDGKQLCPEIIKETSAVARLQFTEISQPEALTVQHLPNPETMTMEQILKFKELMPVLKNWDETLDNFLVNQIRKGVVVPGFKRVQKISRKKWHDADNAVTTLMNLVPETKLYKKTLMSPTQAIEYLKTQKNYIEHLWFVPDAGDTLAPDSDRRMPLTNTAQTDFDYI